MNFKPIPTPLAKKTLLLLVLLNLALYVFIYLFHEKVKFNVENYYYNSHHYKPDTRLKPLGFSLINVLGQFDAQWYLKIAKKGYPEVIKKEINPMNRSLMGSMSYAFFPLYPTTLRFLNIPINNIELTAFIFSNFMIIINVISLIYVIGKKMSEKIAVKASVLLFLFPFSIFFRSYFTESLFLFLLIWYSHFLIKKRMVLSSALFGLLNITRGSAVLLYVPHLYFLLREYRAKTISFTKLLASVSFSVIPLALWSLFNYFQTGDFLYFMKVRSEWIGGINIINRVTENLKKIATPDYQELHHFDSSKVDIFIIFAVFVFLISSFKILNRKLWIISLCLFLSPLIFNSLMSFSRMQIISFPIFIYLATILKGKWFALVSVGFAVGLFIISLYFVNWHWIG